MNSKYSNIPIVELTVSISMRQHKRKAMFSAPHNQYNQSDQILDKEETSKQSCRLTTNAMVCYDIPRIPHWSVALSNLEAVLWHETTKHTSTLSKGQILIPLQRVSTAVTELGQCLDRFQQI